MAHDALLQARPAPPRARGEPGLHRLEAGGRRDSYLYAPPGHDPSRPAPLVLLLHGAGGHAHHGLALLRHLADEHGMILLAPASDASTWDVIVSRAYGPDVRLADKALGHAFAHYAVDPARLAISGFSDGASYALSLGLANGDLFRHIIAFSPGFIAPVHARGAPRVYISHGARDDILPIAPCSRRIVPRLRGAGYEVRYDEFEGGHVIPPEVARGAVEWLFGRG
ncbi:alpha/beta hydrolase-fold protein [Noviherbaspirillum aridicola]|uniref:Esterase n=1 Tax=Noviherbaspirillum aridicola TaxID=2849687 RepID=A0ABQ4Q3K2_9BURK|nr:alpha/beta hydrolase-fold protein [Noviherbaspirillum aridicola]GIZ51370.1 hypothetical protein NCCP691_13840 [Noviherbaspirillum aridicola]